MKSSVDYFKLWFQDKQSIAETMRRNMTADLDAGYNPRGENIAKQLRDIAEYEKQFGEEIMALAEKTEAQADRWCYHDLLRRGAIEI